VSALYVYAFLAGPLARAGRGLAGEAVRVVPCAGLHAAVGRLDAAPDATADALRAHDAVVRRLAARAGALLPARFGSLVEDEAALARVVAPLAVGLGEALALVAGREQMTLRVLGEASPGREPLDAPAGPGTRYLLRAAGRFALRELDPVRAALSGRVVAERVEPHARPPLLASVHHLIPRGEARGYEAAVRAAAPAVAPLALRVSGPWPPYAFAPHAP
jgi:hypothetical protein